MFPRQSIYATIINRRVWLLKVSIFLLQLQLIIDTGGFNNQLVPLFGCQRTGAVLCSIRQDTRFTSFDPIPDRLPIDASFPADLSNTSAFRQQHLFYKYRAAERPILFDQIEILHCRKVFLHRRPL
jgi:hypothetical protein